MPSVYVTWKGRCPRQTDRDALLASIEVTARDHTALWDEPAAKRPIFSDKLAAMRARGLPVEAPMRHWNREIVGRIALLCDVVRDQAALAESAQRAGLEVIQGRYQTHVMLDRLHLEGSDFRGYDPRALYPGEDRFSFIFLRSGVLPCLDGLMAKVSDPDWCKLITAEPLKGTEWYVEGPFVHLRYLLEGWTVKLLSWLRFFHMPGLVFRVAQEPGNYEAERALLEAARAKLGHDRARAETLAHIRDALAAEVADWRDGLAGW